MAVTGWGGRWQDGSAAAAGEELEQLFSYLSRFNITTKYMTAASFQRLEILFFSNKSCHKTVEKSS